MYNIIYALYFPRVSRSKTSKTALKIKNCLYETLSNNDSQIIVTFHAFSVNIYNIYSVIIRPTFSVGTDGKITQKKCLKLNHVLFFFQKILLSLLLLCITDYVTYWVLFTATYVVDQFTKIVVSQPLFVQRRLGRVV